MQIKIKSEFEHSRARIISPRKAKIISYLKRKKLRSKERKLGVINPEYD